MAQTILAAARQLIEQKQYAEARAILLTIQDDPTAVRWLAKLDERAGRNEPSSLYPISPLPASIPAPPQNYTVVPGRRRRERRGYDDEFEPDPLPPVENTSMAGCFRWVWGILTILALLWLVYGCSVSVNAGNTITSAYGFANTPENQAGAFIGSMAVFFCIGAPLLLIFGILYWRNGVAIRETKKHNQMVDAMRRRH